jgi:SAM-dependent methyltransferase
MDDDCSSLVALSTSRRAFGGTSEAVEVAELTDAALRKGEVSWLEVGAGDGENLQFQLNFLGLGRTINVVAVEPAAVEPLARQNVDWIRARIEDYATHRKFDWINVRHSAYYFSDPLPELKRLMGMLTTGGALALTHWSRDCVLYRIHQTVSGDGAIACAGIEDFVAHLTGNPDLVVSAPVFYNSRLDVGCLLRDRSLRDALLDLALRGRSPLGGEDDVLLSLLQTIPSPDVRRNGIVLLRSSRD